MKHHRNERLVLLERHLFRGDWLRWHGWLSVELWLGVVGWKRGRLSLGRIRSENEEAPAISAGAAGKREYAALALHKKKKATLRAALRTVCPRCRCPLSTSLVTTRKLVNCHGSLRSTWLSPSSLNSANRSLPAGQPGPSRTVPSAWSRGSALATAARRPTAGRRARRRPRSGCSIIHVTAATIAAGHLHSGGALVRDHGSGLVDATAASRSTNCGTGGPSAARRVRRDR